MDDLAREYVISYYAKSLHMFGDRPESLRWTSEGQFTRYETLLTIADSIEGSRVLDFGCGKGDLCGFLMDRHIKVNYTGLDINEKLISVATRKYPDSKFRVVDIETDPLDDYFDYIFLCGVFNLEVQGIDELIVFTLKKLFDHCRLGLAFNALSARNPGKDFELHYVSEEEISAFAVKELSPSVRIADSGIPYDFTMFVYRDRRASNSHPATTSSVPRSSEIAR